MSRVKKILLVVLFLVLLSQIPFIYRRYRLGRLNASIQMINSASRQLESTRAEQRDPFSGRYENYTGVFHVHSFLGGHSEGTFQEIISGAVANNLQFVVMTEHVENQFDTSAMTLRGSHGSVVYINGNEVMSKEDDRLLSIPGDISLTGSDKSTTSDIAANSRARSALSIIAYPDEFKSWQERTDGIEVYNVFTNAKRINPVVALFDALWSRWKYPDLLFANYLERPSQSLRKWDELLAQGKISAFAGNDSHSNIGFSLGYGSGEKLLDLKLDPYETSFRLVRLHVLVPAKIEHSMTVRQSLYETNLLEALRAGHFFIGFDLLGDTSNFRFEANNSENSKIQGDEILLQGETRLKVTLPSSARIMIYRDGNVVLDESGIAEKELKITARGGYRVEAYLPQLGKPFSDHPWIISNPIYVR